MDLLAENFRGWTASPLNSHPLEPRHNSQGGFHCYNGRESLPWVARTTLERGYSYLSFEVWPGRCKWWHDGMMDEPKFQGGDNICQCYVKSWVGTPLWQTPAIMSFEFCYFNYCLFSPMNQYISSFFSLIVVIWLIWLFSSQEICIEHFNDWRLKDLQWLEKNCPNPMLNFEVGGLWTNRMHKKVTCTTWDLWLVVILDLQKRYPGSRFILWYVICVVFLCVSCIRFCARVGVDNFCGFFASLIGK